MFNSLVPNLIPNGNGTATILNGNHTSTTATITNASSPPANTLGLKILLDLDSNSVLTKTLINLMKSSFFEKKALNWSPVKYDLVVNNKLMQDFEQIKNEFKASAKEPIEYEEKYGFLIENDHQVNEICQNGYVCPDNTYNVIGQSKAGVYLCKYPDVALRYNEAKRGHDNLTFKMIIFKICYGKQTLALVRKDAKLAPISATVNFNSHMSVIPPKEKDDIEVQFDHSQIYLYELDANKIPNKRPRHCLPYAVITWIKHNDGIEWPINFNDLELTNTISNGETNGLNGHTNGDQNHENTLLLNGNAEKTETNDKSVITNINEDNNNLDENVHKNLNGTSNSSPVNNISELTNIKTDNTTGVTNQTDSVAVKSEITDQNPDQDQTLNEQQILTNQVNMEQTNDQLKTESNLNSEQTLTQPEITNPVSPNSQKTVSITAPDTTQISTNNSNNLSNQNNPTTITTPTRTTNTPSSTTVPTTPTTPATTTATAVTSTTTATNSVVPAATTTQAAPSSTTTTSTYTKSSHSYFPKSSAYTAYRQNAAAVQAAAMAPYLYAAQGHQFSPYGAIRLPFAAGHQQISAVPQTAAFQAALHANQQFITANQAAQQQQQVYLCRGPNGVTYVTAASPNVVQQQIAVAQAQAQAQAQANAILQQQAAVLVQQQVAALPYQTKYQTNQSLASINGALIANQQAPVQQQQIIYQAAPQPATGSAQAKSQAAANQQAQQQQAQQQVAAAAHVPPTQSPKQQQQATQQQQQQQQQNQQQQAVAAANQYAAVQYTASGQAHLFTQNQLNQLQQISSGYPGQPALFAYAQPSAPSTSQVQTGQTNSQTNPAAVPQNVQQFYATTPSAQGAVATQQGYMLAAAQGGLQNAATANQQAVVAAQQQQQLQQLQQLQQQQQQLQQQQQQVASQQLYGYHQLAAAGNTVNLNGYQTQAQAQPAPGSQIGIAQLPAGYQLIDYRQLQTTPGVGLSAGAALQLDQLAAAGFSVGAVPRPRIVNLRHHPYQRP